MRNRFKTEQVWREIAQIHVEVEETVDHCMTKISAQQDMAKHDQLPPDLRDTSYLYS